MSSVFISLRCGIVYCDEWSFWFWSHFSYSFHPSSSPVSPRWRTPHPMPADFGGVFERSGMIIVLLPSLCFPIDPCIRQSSPNSLMYYGVHSFPWVFPVAFALSGGTQASTTWKSMGRVLYTFITLSMGIMLIDPLHAITSSSAWVLPYWSPPDSDIIMHLPLMKHYNGGWSCGRIK